MVPVRTGSRGCRGSIRARANECASCQSKAHRTMRGRASHRAERVTVPAHRTPEFRIVLPSFRAVCGCVPQEPLRGVEKARGSRLWERGGPRRERRPVCVDEQKEAFRVRVERSTEASIKAVGDCGRRPQGSSLNSAARSPSSQHPTHRDSRPGMAGQPQHPLCAMGHFGKSKDGPGTRSGRLNGNLSLTSTS